VDKLGYVQNSQGSYTKERRLGNRRVESWEGRLVDDWVNANRGRENESTSRIEASEAKLRELRLAKRRSQCQAETQVKAIGAKGKAKRTRKCLGEPS